MPDFQTAAAQQAFAIAQLLLDGPVGIENPGLAIEDEEKVLDAVQDPRQVAPLGFRLLPRREPLQGLAELARQAHQGPVGGGGEAHYLAAGEDQAGAGRIAHGDGQQREGGDALARHFAIVDQFGIGTALVGIGATAHPRGGRQHPDAYRIRHPGRQAVGKGRAEAPAGHQPVASVDLMEKQRPAVQVGQTEHGIQDARQQSLPLRDLGQQPGEILLQAQQLLVFPAAGEIHAHAPGDPGPARRLPVHHVAPGQRPEPAPVPAAEAIFQFKRHVLFPAAAQGFPQEGTVLGMQVGQPALQAEGLGGQIGGAHQGLHVLAEAQPVGAVVVLPIADAEIAQIVQHARVIGKRGQGGRIHGLKAYFSGRHAMGPCHTGCSARRGEEAVVVPRRRAATRRCAHRAWPLRVAAWNGAGGVAPLGHGMTMAGATRLAFIRSRPQRMACLPPK